MALWTFPWADFQDFEFVILSLEDWAHLRSSMAFIMNSCITKFNIDLIFLALDLATNMFHPECDKTKSVDWKSRVTKTSSSSKQSNRTSSSQKQQRTYEIECFKCEGRGHYFHDCANTRLLLILDNGQYTFDSDTLDPDMPKLIDNDNDGGEFYGEEEVLDPDMRHTINFQVRVDHDL
ncbi:hypothetical protein PVK06_019927 [Gossypium arboreum]|uniref:CCHC-type domain-containing protein n=1 Tax=Gossypium arboreum TaxID=29729 RepID=A0ABR0PL65_GOSAR|nr:hypothetical protein PVK06_019927 [Gossypium arboreum]